MSTGKRKGKAFRKRLEKQEVAEIEERSKLRGMRPAEDVYHRIKWDASLNSADFAVCFLGLDPDAPPGEEERILIESPFDEFDPDVVPMHVVRKFKYLGRVIWDRVKQRDDFFGSQTVLQQTQKASKGTRAPLTIELIMERAAAAGMLPGAAAPAVDSAAAAITG